MWLVLVLMNGCPVSIYITGEILKTRTKTFLRSGEWQKEQKWEEWWLGITRVFVKVDHGGQRSLLEKVVQFNEKHC